MQDQRIEKIAAAVTNITKVLLIIYLAVEEVFKIIKSLQKLSLIHISEPTRPY